MKVLKSWVCGEWHEGTGKRADLHDPVTEEKIAETGTGGVDFAAVLEHARTVGGESRVGRSRWQIATRCSPLEAWILRAGIHV